MNNVYTYGGITFVAIFTVALFFPLVRSWWRKPGTAPHPRQAEAEADYAASSRFMPALTNWLENPKKHQRSPGTVKVDAAEQGVTVKDMSKWTEKAFAWTDVSRITLITTDKGPWHDDLFYHVMYTGGEITLPSKAQGMSAFNEHLKILPGYNAEAHAAAIRSTVNNSFAVIFQA